MKKTSLHIISETSSAKGRRDFLKSAALGTIGLAGLGMTLPGESTGTKKTKVRSRSEKIKSMAANSYAVNALFKRRAMGQRPERQEITDLKTKYRELTLLDFPQFAKETYPGVTQMDLWSSLFGEFTDDSMYVRIEREGQVRMGEFDPASASSKKYLDTLVSKMGAAGVMATHISNNAPRNLADPDEELRKEGIRVGKLWLDASKQIGARSMRVNTGGPQIIPASKIQGGYPRNEEIVPYIKNAIESFKELADYGGKVGVKLTIENHWGLAADPVNIIIILNEVNHPFCEASPDYCNWEHEYMLYNGLEILAPRATSMIHAKRWTRFPDVDIARCTAILNRIGYKGFISNEYEAGGDPVEGSIKLFNDVVDALV